MRLTLICFLTLNLSACSNFTGFGDTTSEVTREEAKAELPEKSVHYYSATLAQQMLSNPLSINPNSTIAVGTFLPAVTLNHTKDKNRINDLGVQVQESLTVLFTQAGFNLIEYKTTNNIKVKQNQDIMLSRDITNLKGNHTIDYFLSGTILEQETSYIVNAKLIKISNKNVIAAATEIMPRNIFWSKEKVLQQNGKLYRSEY